MLKCPHCNVELEVDDTYEMSYDDEGIILNRIGHCPECEREYQWEESAAIHHWEITKFRLV